MDVTSPRLGTRYGSQYGASGNCGKTFSEYEASGEAEYRGKQSSVGWGGTRHRGLVVVAEGADEALRDPRPVGGDADECGYLAGRPATKQ